MRLFELPADNITHDNVTYSTATPASGLTVNPNCFEVAVGDNVLKYRQNEILNAVEWAMTRAMADQDTTRFPRPAYGANGGGTFYKVKFITTNTGVKFLATLVTSTNLTSVPFTDEDAVYWGLTVGTAALAVNDACRLGSVGQETGFNEIKHFYLASAEASA